MQFEPDAFGVALRDYLRDGEGFMLTERDDGDVRPSGGPEMYFAPYEEWTDREQTAVERVRGRVLDVGCGAGRHALHLQAKDHEVVGIDTSPGALAVCRERGVERVERCDVADADSLDGAFDTVLMLGNNFGLVGSRDRAPTVLGALDAVTASDAIILAESMDPRDTDDEFHLAYHERNRERGRLPGRVRIRVRYKRHATDWFDYLHVSPEEMREVVEPTAWTVTEVVDGEDAGFVGVLEKA